MQKRGRAPSNTSSRIIIKERSREPRIGLCDDKMSSFALTVLVDSGRVLQLYHIQLPGVSLLQRSVTCMLVMHSTSLKPVSNCTLSASSNCHPRALQMACLQLTEGEPILYRDQAGKSNQLDIVIRPIRDGSLSPPQFEVAARCRGNRGACSTSTLGRQALTESDDLVLSLLLLQDCTFTVAVPGVVLADSVDFVSVPT